MKTISLFRRGQPFFCPFLIGSLLFTALAARPATLLRAGAFETVAFQSIITGTVSDAAGPLPGVAVRVLGTQRETLTDADGRYSIQAKRGDALSFSYMGYAPRETVVLEAHLDIELEPDRLALPEVVVNAGYYTVTEAERTGSIARITAAQIKDQPVTNILAAMQGRMAGVEIRQNTGMPGGGFDIRIRGQNSLRTDGNAPLYVIDGVPYDATPLSNGATTQVLSGKPSPLAGIPPDQVASIEVLKDADATAIYGSRGANGVVLVTTKRGKAGPARLDVRFLRGAGRVTRFMKLLNTQQYLAMRREAFANDGIAEYPEYAYDVNGTWDQERYTDWQQVLLGGMAEQSAVQASFATGTERTSFLLSGGFSEQGTVFPGHFRYKTGSLRASVSHRSPDGRLGLDFSAGLSLQDNLLPPTDFSIEAQNLAPNAPALYASDGSLNWEGGTFQNPLRNTLGRYASRNADLVASLRASWRLAEGLEAIASTGGTLMRLDDDNLLPSTRYSPSMGLGPEASYMMVTAARRSSWIAEPQLHYEKAFGRHRIDMVAGATFQFQQGASAVQVGSGFASNSLLGTLGAASAVYVTADEQREYRYMAGFARANYSYASRYILNLTGRRDGSSRFGPGRQFASFGATGAAWLFHKEAFATDSHWLSFGKLRASYGVAGSDQIGDYQFLDTYALSGASYNGHQGLQPARLFNPDFAWESSRKLEAGVELGFLKDRIFLTVAWYRNRSGNQLAGIPLPATAGFPTVQANLDAVVENRGLELTLRTANIENKTFGWTTDVNFSMARNRLLSFPGLEGSTYASRYAVGEPLSIQKLFRYEGIDPATGTYRFADLDGDGVLSEADRLDTADFSPKFFGGLRNEFRWGPLRLDFLLQFVKQENRDLRRSMGAPGGMGNQSHAILDHTVPGGPAGATQVYTAGFNSAALQAQYRYSSSTAVVADASYVRLKNISLSWDVPLRQPGFGCQLSVQAQNLLTWTPYRGGDPEFSAGGSLPPLRIITAGIALSL